MARLWGRKCTVSSERDESALLHDDRKASPDRVSHVVPLTPRCANRLVASACASMSFTSEGYSVLISVWNFGSTVSRFRSTLPCVRLSPTSQRIFPHRPPRPRHRTLDVITTTEANLAKVCGGCPRPRFPAHLGLGTHNKRRSYWQLGQLRRFHRRRSARLDARARSAEIKLKTDMREALGGQPGSA